MPWYPVALICSLSLTDINECVTERHTCQRREHCVNTMGSFRCLQELSCPPGHELKDGECVGKKGVLQLWHKGKGMDCRAFWCCCSVPSALELKRAARHGRVGLCRLLLHVHLFEVVSSDKYKLLENG